MTTQRQQIYKCEVCGNIAEILEAGGGELNCCGQPMVLLKENASDASKEKHVPVVTSVPGGIKVSVGSIPHPMEAKHLIQWIEVLVDGKVLRQTLHQGQAPEAIFPVSASGAVVRAYCNLHGLWKA